jgi:hypothetical protein
MLNHLLNRLKKFLNLTYYTSDLDKFMHKYRRDHQRLSASQATEKKKYDRIFELRDHAIIQPVKKSFWSKF